VSYNVLLKTGEKDEKRNIYLNFDFMFFRVTDIFYVQPGKLPELPATEFHAC
jgi:hypothetical protein